MKTTIPILEKKIEVMYLVGSCQNSEIFILQRSYNIWSKDFASVEPRILNKIGEVIEKQIYTPIVKGDLASSIKYKR